MSTEAQQPKTEQPKPEKRGFGRDKKKGPKGDKKNP